MSGGIKPPRQYSVGVSTKEKIEGRDVAYMNLQVWCEYVVKQEEFCTVHIHIVTIILILQVSDPHITLSDDHA